MEISGRTTYVYYYLFVSLLSTILRLINVIDMDRFVTLMLIVIMLIVYNCYYVLRDIYIILHKDE